MKKSYLFILFLFILGCKEDADDTVFVTPEENLEVEDFVYKVMNLGYYWQKDVPELADDKFSNDKEYTDFLQSFSGPEVLFAKLLFGEDRFSVISDDYISFEKQLNSVIKTNGMKYGLVRYSNSDNGVFGYVRYVLPDTDAAQKGIERGDLFTHVDGVALTIDNFSDLLATDKATYSIELATISGNQLQPSGTTIDLVNTEQTEKELYLSSVISHDGKKVGYLMYNGFNADQEGDLTAAFDDFATQQIDELVVDLRYNSGGRVSTSQKLAGLIAGEHSGKVYGTLEYNDKLSENNVTLNIESNFTLGLSRVLFLTTRSSASASEMLINGLAPHITTVQIGGTTYGKNVGSIPIYDYIDDNKTKNPNHTYMLLPIVFKYFNSLGLSDYANGLTPDVSIGEDIANLGVLGDVTEPLFKRALDYISGQTSGGEEPKTNNLSTTLFEIQLEKGKAIYIPE
ncbi:MAG: S41 family peptidase [Flavobacteriaceae bacterium]